MVRIRSRDYYILSPVMRLWVHIEVSGALLLTEHNKKTLKPAKISLSSEEEIGQRVQLKRHSEKESYLVLVFLLVFVSVQIIQCPGFISNLCKVMWWLIGRTEIEIQRLFTLYDNGFL